MGVNALIVQAEIRTSILAAFAFQEQERHPLIRWKCSQRTSGSSEVSSVMLLYTSELRSFLHTRACMKGFVRSQFLLYDSTEVTDWLSAFGILRVDGIFLADFVVQFSRLTPKRGLYFLDLHSTVTRVDSKNQRKKKDSRKW